MQATARCQCQPFTPAAQQQRRPRSRQQPQAPRSAAPWARPAAAATPQPRAQLSWLGRGLAAAGVASLLLLGSGSPADAVGTRQPPVQEEEGRCSIEALDKFADTRASFSMEASGGGMTEANVDIRGCNYANLDLGGKVLSGVLMQDSDFSGSKMVGIQFARALAQGAALRGADMTDANCYSTRFDGADLEDAQFENAILSSSSFGKYQGKWANLKGAHFEGALLSSSDVVRICENPTLDDYTKKAELGCRGSR